MKEKVFKEDLAVIELGEVSEVTLGPPFGPDLEPGNIPFCFNPPCS